MKDNCILWCQQDGSDKLWGITETQGATITFWGKRGKVLTFKHVEIDDALRLRDKKLKKGYRETTYAIIEANTPEFSDMMEEQLVLCILSDGFHGERYNREQDNQ